MTKRFQTMRSLRYSGRYSGTILLIAIIAAVLFPPDDSRAETPVEAAVDRTGVSLGETFELEITLTNVEGEVDLSPLTDFRVLSRRDSTSISLVNGDYSRKIIYHYRLTPRRSGVAVIPPLPVRVGGNTYLTNEIRVNVAERGQQPKSDGKDIFVTAGISKQVLYESEQAIYTFRLYQATQIRNAQFGRPDFGGFTVTQIGNQRSFDTVVDGKRYEVVELSYLLIPISAGEKRIEPAEIGCEVLIQPPGTRQRRFDLFDNPFFSGGRIERRVLRTEAVTVSVKPLPPYHGEGEFSGLVGEFDIRAALERDEVKAGDSLTLSLTVSGRGNIVDAEKPPVDLPAVFKLYYDAPEEKVRLDQNGYSGDKIFRVAVVPVREGAFTIPPVRLVYFDPETASYVMKESRPMQLAVAPPLESQPLEVAGGSPDAPAPLRKKVAFTGRDILPLKASPDALMDRSQMTVTAFAGWMAGPPLLFMLCWLAAHATKRGKAPSVRMARRAEQALRDAALAQADADRFMQAIYRATISAILARNGGTGETLTHSEIESILRFGGCSEEKIEDCIRLLDKIESVRFGGASVDDAFRSGMLEETRDFVRTVKP